MTRTHYNLGLVCFSPNTLIIGSINGLICSTGNWMYSSWPTPNDIWIWNPSTGLSKKLPTCIHKFQRFSNYQATFAFCWDEESDVYKVVRIISKKCEPTIAEVWSSHNNSWEEIDHTKHPSLSSFYHPSHPVNVVPTTSCNVFVGNSPHWAVLDYYGNPFIMSFDVKTNKLKLSYFPSQLSSHREKISARITSGLRYLIVTNWMGKLAVLDAVDDLSADDEYEKLANVLSDTERTADIYWLWTMEANGHWTRSCLFSFGFDFHYCLNSVGGGKFMLLHRYSDIAFYDIVERRVIRTYGVPSVFPNRLSSGFDFVGSLVSIEGSEPFGNDFSGLITLTWPNHMNSNGKKHRKQLLRLPEEGKIYEGGMKSDPEEMDVLAPFWERQNHFNPFERLVPAENQFPIVNDTIYWKINKYTSSDHDIILGTGGFILNKANMGIRQQGGRRSACKGRNPLKVGARRRSPNRARRLLKLTNCGGSWRRCMGKRTRWRTASSTG
ncbi:Unknown protein [Striga hermonthica]|uniref:F-box associated beta-propeller type 3 domain-containing protein n=1 Tax=Striga hermonthica TaxID=68872 RepID=A0A9N7ML25_STRHE|nr:Unknown protein [Striga hermonthica]